MSKKYLLDMDGVTVDFVGGVAHWFNRPDILTHWKPGITGAHKIIGMSIFDFWEEIHEASFWRTLRKTKECDGILELLEGEQVCLLSSPAAGVGTATWKIQWIKKYLPQFKSNYLIGLAKEFCAHPDAVIIDDFDYNIKIFKEHGGQGILFPRPWNSLHDITDPVGYLKEQLCQLK